MRLFFAILICLFYSPAIAETVSITGGSGEKGQGWLFGSPNDANCWIATPHHVVTASDGQAKNFLWQDIEGYQGEGFAAIRVDQNLDLVFARVTGRKKGECLSRLGPVDSTGRIRRQPYVEAMIIQSTHASPKSMQIRDFSDEFVIFSPTDTDAENAMKPGLSGAPLVLRESNQDIALGLVITVEKNGQHGHAIRFDHIQSLFKSISVENISELENAYGSVNIGHLSTTGLSIDPSTGLTALFEPGKCWQASPIKGKRSYSLFIELTEDQSGSQAVFNIDRRCGASPDAILVEMPVGEDRWTAAGDCLKTAEKISCRWGVGAPKNHRRFKFISRDGSERAVSALAISN